MSPCQAPTPRKCKIPYKSAAAAAVATFSELDPPALGQRDQLVARPRHPRAQPLPLRAEHQHDPARVVRVVVRHGLRARPRRRRPRRRRPWPRRASRRGCRTRATGRCSTAPADALQAAGVTSARAALGDHHAGRAGRLGHAAHRAEVVRVLDLVERDHQRVVVDEQRGRVGVRVAARPRRRCPGDRATPAEPLDPRAPRTACTSTPSASQSSASRRPRSPRRARSALPPPAQRLAHGVAAVDDHSRCARAARRRACRARRSRAPRAGRGARRRGRSRASARACLALGQQPLGVRVGGLARVGLEQVLEPERVQHLRQRAHARACSPASRRRFASPTHSNRTARAAGVLKSSARASKKRSAYSSRPSGGGASGSSRRPSSRSRSTARPASASASAEKAIGWR